MIQSRTARKMLYSWHGGQSCPLYACNGMKDSKEHPQDHAKLTEWIKYKKAKQKFSIVVQGQSYAVLPWVSRSY